VRGLQTFVLALALSGFGAAHAQQFTRAQVSAGPIYNGQLTTAFPRLEDGSYVDCHVLQTVSGRNYTITLRSREFDTYLMLVAGGCQDARPDFNNDDFESGSTDSQIAFTAAASSYGVYVNSYGADETGRYTIQVTERGGAAANTTSNTANASTRSTAGAASGNTAQPGYSEGWAALERNDYAAAARLLRPFADAGDQHAQNAMGFLNFFGRGVPQNRLEAARWYGLAAAQGNEQAQRALNEYAPHIMEARFVDHIDRYGPDTTDVGTFHYDVSVYCIYRGPNCQTWRARAQQFQDRWNARAEAANMRRIWGLYGGDSAEEMRQSRERSACLRRVTESIQRQTYGQQTWRYVNNC